MNKQSLLVRGARQLLTLRGPSGPRRGPSLQELAIIPDGAVLIVDGRVEDVGPSRRIENLATARGALEVNAAGKVVMPGFVDSHTQIVFAHHGTRPSESGPFIMQEAVQAGARAMHAVTGGSLQARAAKLTHGMVRHGTCTIEAKSGYGLDYSGELKTLRVHAALDRNPLDIVSTFFGASAIPIEYQNNGDAYLNYVRTEMLPTIGRRKLARFVDIRCEEGAFSLTQATAYLEAARHLKFGVKVQTGPGPPSEAIRLAIEMKAVAIGHSSYLAPADRAMLAGSSVVTTLLPDSVFQSGEETSHPARALIDEGGIVALASNFNPDTNPAYNMQTVISLACRYLGMTPAEAISAATINGAHAIGSPQQVGSLEPGKCADLLLMNVSDYRDIPYYAGVNNVHMTIKRGVIIYKEGGIRPPEQIDGQENRGVRPQLLRWA